MLSRLLERGKTSGREDDNVESIKKRFRTLRWPDVISCLWSIGTYKIDTMPVIEHYSTQKKVAEVCFFFFSFWWDLMIPTRSIVQDRWRMFTSQLVQLSRIYYQASVS